MICCTYSCKQRHSYLKIFPYLVDRYPLTGLLSQCNKSIFFRVLCRNFLERGWGQKVDDQGWRGYHPLLMVVGKDLTGRSLKKIRISSLTLM